MFDMYVNEIFKSVSGEVGLITQGSIATFIRLEGCNIRCSYCDTPQALNSQSKNIMTGEAILRRVKELNCNQVIITGGEPVVQRRGLKDLVDALMENGYIVQIETNGTLELDFRPDCWVVDYKLSGAGIKNKLVSKDSTELRYFETHVLNRTRHGDYIKFVCHTNMDIHDAEFIMGCICELIPQASLRPKFAIAATGNVSTKDVFDAMINQKFDVTLNVQIHKIAGLR